MDAIEEQPCVTLSARKSKENQDQNGGQYFDPPRPFMPCPENMKMHGQGTLVSSVGEHNCGANLVVPGQTYQAFDGAPVAPFYYSEETMFQASYGPAAAMTQPGYGTTIGYSAAFSAWNYMEEGNWDLEPQAANLMMQPGFDKEFVAYNNNNGTTNEANVDYSSSYFPSPDYSYEGMYSSQDLVDEQHLTYPAEDEATYSGIPNGYGVRFSSPTMTEASNQDPDPYQLQEEEELDDSYDDVYPTAEDCFQLEEISREEVKWIIERLVVNLLRNGELTFEAPSSFDRFCIDGVLRVGKRTRTLKIFSPTLSKGFVVLSIAHQLCLQDRTATIREIFYRNKAGRNQASNVLRFKDERQCERAILTACLLTGATRASLNLVSNPKGYVCGITMNPHPVPIPTFNSFDDLEWIVDVISRRSKPPAFVLIVEKFSVFHNLVQSEYFSSTPFIAVTGKGFPDLATRKFCRFLRERLNLACLGICDFNPFGLGVMGTYAYGSTRMAGEAFRYVIPDLVVLGLSSQDGEEFQHLTQGRLQDHLQPFTKADELFLKGLRVISEIMENEFIWREVEEMAKLRCKLELDVLEDVHPGYLFSAWLPQKVQNAAVHFSS